MPTPKWDKLSWQQRRLYIRLLKRDGHTDQAICDFFGVSNRTIVGYRQRHLPFLTGGPIGTKQVVEPERFAELLEREKMRREERKKSRRPETPVPKEAWIDNLRKQIKRRESIETICRHLQSTSEELGDFLRGQDLNLLKLFNALPQTDAEARRLKAELKILSRK